MDRRGADARSRPRRPQALGRQGRCTICWLALLLIGGAEDNTSRTWARVSRELDRLAAVTLTGPAGPVVQTTEPTEAHRALLSNCKVPLQPRITALTPA